MPASKQLKIMLWNAQSINQPTKQQMLTHTLQTEQIDIVILVETYLKPTHTFNINNYMILRNDRRTQAHGGVAIAIRDSIPHKHITSTNTNSIENVAIEVTINNTPTVIIAAYSPKYTQHFERDIQSLTSTNKQFMIFGDLNAKHTSWNCNVNNTAGNKLYSLQQSNNFLVFHTADHTHHPHSGQTSSTIDLLLSNVNFSFQLAAHPDQMSSDHVPVICSTAGNINSVSKTCFDYSKANWRKYRHIIDHSTADLVQTTTANDIDLATEQLISIILNARAKCIPTKTINNRSQISDFTKQIIALKNIIQRQCQRTQCQTEKRKLKRIVNKYQKKISELIETEQNQQWNNKLQNISKGDKKLWNLTRKFKGKTDSTTNKIKINGSAATDDMNRANCLAKIFSKSHTITATYTHENDATVRQTIQSFNSFSFISCETPAINPNEVQQIIKTLRPFKAPGPDGIQNILLKNLPRSAVNLLTAIFNKCIEIGYWPSKYKIAKVVPILKSGKSPSDPQNYRPISLLNAIGKIFERIVYSRLVEFIDKKNLLPAFQFGFRKGHSTIHQAMRIKQHIIRNKRIRKSTGMILLDIEKAFDSIWHDGLIYKLIKMKLPTYLVRLLNSFIRKRQFAVHVNDAISNIISIPAGLAQGTCISPILYALYVADIPIPHKCEIALYADDTSIYTSAKRSNTIINRLNSNLQSLKQYFFKWKIKLNASKTQAIFFPFDNKRKRIPTANINDGQNTIELTNAVNYLGIKFDQKLTFAHHLSTTLNKTNKCYRALLPLLAPKSKLSLCNKKLIYASLIRPIMAYASPVWSTAANSHTIKLNILQNKILKMIFKLPRRTPTYLLPSITDFIPFNEFTHMININFSQNCSMSNYELIREIDLM